jgi:hypothetical protein
LLIDSLAPFEPGPFVPLDATGVSAVCHIPPDTLSEPYAIMIETNAVPVHLAHGDYQGACDGEETSVSCDGMCDPILLILADSFSVPYAELAVLEAQGFGAGTIAQLYILAEITGAHTDELAESLLAGVTWQEILQSQPRTEHDVLASHSIIGNGRSESVRVTQ